MSKGYGTGLDRPDALIFDIDGTLWDAAEPTARGWNQALAGLGVDTRVTIAGIRSVAGTPFAACVEILLPELCPPAEKTLHRLDTCEQAAIVEAGGILYPGVYDGVHSLSSVYPLLLVSNCQDWYFELFLAKSGLGHCFVGGDCSGRSGLPKSDMLLRLARAHGLKHATYAGDTRGDRDAARGAGMDFAYARYGFGAALDPALAFDSFTELTGHYLAKPRKTGPLNI